MKEKENLLDFEDKFQIEDNFDIYPLTESNEGNMNKNQATDPKKNGNSLSNNFDKQIHLNMTNLEIVKFLFISSIFCIATKVLLDISNSITTSFLGHLNGDRLSPFFIASIIQNIGFKSIGFGIATASNMLGCRHFGENNLYELGQSINRGRFVVFIFTIICGLVSLFGKPLFELIFSSGNINLAHTFLIHNSFGFLFYLQITMHTFYLNSQNCYLPPGILDSISAGTQYCIFKLFFTIFSDKIADSSEFAMIITAWCLNLTYFLQFVYYTLFIVIFKPSPESNICFNRDTFKLSQFLCLSMEFGAFSVSSFLGGEQNNVLIQRYYKSNLKYFNALGVAQKMYFMIQKFTYGVGFVLLNVTGSLVKKGAKPGGSGYLLLLKRITKIYYFFSFGIIILLVLIVEILAYPLCTIYTNKPELLEISPNLMRILSLIAVLFHLQVTFQKIISGHNVQKWAAYFSLIFTPIGGLGFGYLFIYILDLGVYGVFITQCIIESSYSVVNFIVMIKMKENKQKVTPDDI